MGLGLAYLGLILQGLPGDVKLSTELSVLVSPHYLHQQLTCTTNDPGTNSPRVTGPGKLHVVRFPVLPDYQTRMIQAKM